MCEDFEATADGATPAGNWSLPGTNYGTGTIAVASDFAARGSRALKVTIPTSGPSAEKYLQRGSIAALASGHFGRIFFRVQGPTTTAFVHWDLITGAGPYMGSNRRVRWGVTGTGIGTTDNNWAWIYNIEQGDTGVEARKVHPTLNAWMCVEWQWDAANQRVRFYFNDTEATPLHVDTTLPNGTALQLPTFSSMSFGLAKYQNTTADLCSGSTRSRSTRSASAARTDRARDVGPLDGDLIAAYRHHAAEHGVATAAGDYKKGDAHRDRLTDVLGFLRQRDAEGDDALLDVLHDDNPSVRAWAATHSLTVDAAQARARLLHRNGFAGRAQGALDRAGALGTGRARRPQGPRPDVPAGQPGTHVVPSLPSTAWLPSGQQVDPRRVSIWWCRRDSRTSALRSCPGDSTSSPGGSRSWRCPRGSRRRASASR